MSVHATRHPYATLDYAATLAHVGRPLDVPEWRSAVIARTIDERCDASGPYPLACLAPDADIGAGLERLRHEKMVSVTLVAQDLAGPPVARLRQLFSYARPFKTHHLVDIARYRPSAHHAYEIRKAARRGVEVREVRLADVLDEWVPLYDALLQRRSAGRVHRFGRAGFAALARCEGLRAIGGYLGDELVCCHLWIEYGDVVWSHLAASNARGYAASAAYAVHDQSILRLGRRVVDLGGAAGAADDPADGLARFKAGFSNRTETAWLLGAALDAAAYDALCARHAVREDVDYFPAYRAPGSVAETVATGSS